MHTKNKGKPKKNNKTQAYSTPGPGPGQARARAWVPGANWGSQAQTGGAASLRFIVFQWVSCFLGMHMPLLGWKLILGWILFKTYV